MPHSKNQLRPLRRLSTTYKRPKHTNTDTQTIVVSQTIITVG